MFVRKGVLTCDTFESVDEIQEAIGEVLESCCLTEEQNGVNATDDNERQIKHICDKLFDAINVSVIQSIISFDKNIDLKILQFWDRNETTANGRVTSRLSAPVHLG